MKKTIIAAVFVTSLVIANVVAGKVVDVFGFMVPGAVLLYGITFLMTDLTNEIYGPREAQRLVKAGFVAAVFAAAMIALTQLLPAAPFATEESKAYDILLGQNWRFVLASMAAYYISQTCDVWIFAKIREKMQNRSKWVRNNVSTATSQLIDTAIFITIAFAGNVPELGWMILSQYVVKLVIAAIDTPLFYLGAALLKGEATKNASE